MGKIGQFWRRRTKHWLKVASVEWRHIESVAREELMSTLATCECVLSNARENDRDQRLNVANELDAFDGSQLMPSRILGKLTEPLASYGNEYAFRLLQEWDGAAAFSIRQAKVLPENPELGVGEDRRDVALNKCAVVWTESGLKEAAQWWLTRCYSPDHMPRGLNGPVQEMAKIVALAPEGVSLETKAKGFAAELAEWIASQHANVSPAALPFVLTMEPTYEFNAWSFSARKRNWLKLMTNGFAWALIGEAAVYETLTLPDQSRYEGEHRNGKPHGYGKQTLPDGMRYEGEFRNGKPQSRGTLAWTDGHRLVSRWNRGRSCGSGAMKLKSFTRGRSRVFGVIALMLALAGFLALWQGWSQFAEERLFDAYWGVCEDNQQTVSWYRKAAEQGDVSAQHTLGFIYANGLGIPEDDKQSSTWYRKAAEQGHADAQVRLGDMYLYGRGVPKDEAQALIWYRKAAEQGHMAWYLKAVERDDAADAQFMLDVMYANGEDAPEDVEQAVAWFLNAAEQGDTDAQIRLGDMYTFVSRSTPEDKAQAVAWYLKAAEQGDADAQIRLGGMYHFGLGVPEDDALAAIWYLKAAEQGDARAQFNLGRMYDNGLGVPEDGALAATWFLKAAEQGDADAQIRLGDMYAFGRGVPDDEAQAVAWFLKAAEQGDADAQLRLGDIYAFVGRSIPKDEAQAMTWYLKAAEQGDADAQFNLGLMYDNGVGVPEDNALAATWYLKAAGQGDADSQFNLGLMYAKGRGVPKDDALAATWYRKAAEQGDAAAQFELGDMYAKGKGVPKDDVGAYAWFNLAAAQYQEDAGKTLKRLRRSMDSAQIAQAQRFSLELLAQIDVGPLILSPWTTCKP